MRHLTIASLLAFAVMSLGCKGLMVTTDPNAGGLTVIYEDPDGEFVISGTDNGEFVTINFEGGVTVERTLPAHGDPADQTDPRLARVRSAVEQALWGQP